MRNDRSIGFAERFVEQWLHTRELSMDKVPDAKLFPTYAEGREICGPISVFSRSLFFREVFLQESVAVETCWIRSHTIGPANWQSISD